jgi:hypothetical protein
MKHLKMLALAAVSVGALLAVAGVGTASATVICKNNLNTTTCSEKYPVGTEGTASLAAGTSAQLTNTAGESVETCRESVVKSTLKEAGSSMTTVKSGVSTMTFSACTFPTTVINGGSAELHHIAGTDNGTLTTFNTEVTINTFFFGSCIYGPESGADVGTTVGGNPGSMTLNVIALKKPGSSFACPETTKFTGKYVATSPTNAWVAAG